MNLQQHIPDGLQLVAKLIKRGAKWLKPHLFEGWGERKLGIVMLALGALALTSRIIHREAKPVRGETTTSADPSANRSPTRSTTVNPSSGQTHESVAEENIRFEESPDLQGYADRYGVRHHFTIVRSLDLKLVPELSRFHGAGLYEVIWSGPSALQFVEQLASGDEKPGGRTITIPPRLNSEVTALLLTRSTYGSRGRLTLRTKPFDREVAVTDADGFPTTLGVFIEQPVLPPEVENAIIESLSKMKH